MSDSILLYYVSNQYVRTINLIIIFGQRKMPKARNIITEEAQYSDPKSTRKHMMLKDTLLNGQ